MKTERFFGLLILLSLLIWSPGKIVAQNLSDIGVKPAIDKSAYGKWGQVGDGSISNNGMYASYRVEFIYAKRRIDELVIKSLYSNWEVKLAGASNFQFSQDSHWLVCKLGGDSMCVISLGNSNKEFVSNVNSFFLFKYLGNEWLVYKINKFNKELIIRNLSNGTNTVLSSVDDYFVSQDGSTICLQTTSNDSSRRRNMVLYFTGTDTRKVIWESAGDSEQVGDVCFDDSSRQIAYIVNGGLVPIRRNSLWYYHIGQYSSKKLLDDNEKWQPNLYIDHISRFSKDGRRLFLSLREGEVKTANPDMVKVDVWSYRDTALQSEQVMNQLDDQFYEAVIEVDGSRLRCLQKLTIGYYGVTNYLNDEFILLSNQKGNPEEKFWSLGARPSNYIISTEDGRRADIPFGVTEVDPEGKYLIGVSQNEKLFSYEILSGRIMNISSEIPVPEIVEEESLKTTKEIAFVGWLRDGRALFTDQFDIWMVDLRGKKSPVCLTNGYGRKNNIMFSIGEMTEDDIIDDPYAILLSAFNLRNKQNGFYFVNRESGGDPTLLTMGSYLYYTPLVFVYGSIPVKAKDADVYLILRQNANESPNLFWTKDFKDVHPVSNNYPESQYNGVQAELVNFRTKMGEINQGVLYRPENFTPSSKYPAIIQYYQIKSNDLNKYRGLEDVENFSIRWFVSHGYVVFTPDIHFKIGQSGACALDAVLGATSFLSGKPWIDSNHIGVEGHSYGGFETNYIVTHSHRFAAAISSSGSCDLMSEYGALWGLSGGSSKENYFENRQGRMGVMPWLDPKRYIVNSPDFYLDKITTPVLLVNDKSDGSVWFQQGLEMFLGMRRLGKKVWMLQYDGQGHGLGAMSMIDFTLRAQQFYDYYLKNEQAPVWMVEGIPARKKGVEDGLLLEPSGIRPGSGLAE